MELGHFSAIDVSRSVRRFPFRLVFLEPTFQRGAPTFNFRAAGERLSLASEREEFLAQEARAAQLQRDRAERRAEAAEARAANVANDVKELERALQTEELRARTAEGEAADLRTAVGTVGWDHGDRETVMDYERKLEESEAARERLTDEIERLTGQGSLLGVERTAQQVAGPVCGRKRRVERCCVSPDHRLLGVPCMWFSLDAGRGDLRALCKDACSAPRRGFACISWPFAGGGREDRRRLVAPNITRSTLELKMFTYPDVFQQTTRGFCLVAVFPCFPSSRSC